MLRVCSQPPSYLVPAAVSCVTRLRAHVGAHHGWRGRGDGDMRHSGRGLCRHSDGRAVISLAQLLWVLIPNNQMETNDLYTEKKTYCMKSVLAGRHIFTRTRSPPPSLFHPAPSAVSGAPHTQKAHCRGQKHETMKNSQVTDSKGFRVSDF